MRILIADDHAMFRHAIAALLTPTQGFDIVAEAANGAEAVELTTELRPDLVLMDISMPGLSSFDATRRIKSQHPQTKVLFLSMHDDRELVREAMRSGASGYLLKDTPAAELAEAIRKIAAGGTHMTPRILSQMIEDLRMIEQPDGSASLVESLTRRERQVLKLLAEGQSSKQIATQLELSIKTVESHKMNMMRKLDLHNRSEVVQFAVQRKIITLDDRSAPVPRHGDAD